MSNAPNTTTRFKKDLAEFRSRWPGVMVATRDRARYNRAMLAVNERARFKKKQEKHKKKLAT